MGFGKEQLVEDLFHMDARIALEKDIGGRLVLLLLVLVDEDKQLKGAEHEADVEQLDQPVDAIGVARAREVIFGMEGELNGAGLDICDGLMHEEADLAIGTDANDALQTSYPSSRR